MVPQHGQGAVGEAARTVMVTSVVIRTCSITRSERSGMMVIGSHWIWKTSRRRTCLVLQYTTCGISGPAEEPNYVSTEFGTQTDTIFFYTKSEKNYFQNPIKPLREEYIEQFYRFYEPDG